MPDQTTSSSKKEKDKTEGLTPEERKCLEACMRRNDELMKCLAEM